MVSVQARRIGRREAEELLSGGPAGVDRTELVRVLELAAAPAQPDELRGRESAVAAFIRAASFPADRPVRTRHRRALSGLPKALAVKVLAVVAVLSLGGVAVAASTGNLPPSVQHGAHDLLAPWLSVPDPTGGASESASPGAGPGSGSGTGPGRSAVPSADAATHGMCEAWQAGQKRGHPKDVDPGALRALAAAAGGTDNIPAFCAAVLAQPAPTPSVTPDPNATTLTPTPTPTSGNDDNNNNGQHGNPTKSPRR
jgi:hypothetical protein